MSARLITVAQLIEELNKHPPGMFVVIPERHLSPGEMQVEGNLDGPIYQEVVTASEVRSGFLYPADKNLSLEPIKVLTLSSCGVDVLQEDLEDDETTEIKGPHLDGRGREMLPTPSKETIQAEVLRLRDAYKHLLPKETT